MEGITLEACDCRLQIGYVDSLCDSFGIPLEVGIVGWIDTCCGWHFSYGYLTTTDTCDYFQIKCLCFKFLVGT